MGYVIYASEHNCNLLKVIESYESCQNRGGGGIYIYIYIWERPINCLGKLVQQKKLTPEEQQIPGLQMPAQPGSQPAAGRSMGRPASRPGSRAAAQPGRQAIFGLASEQPADRRAGPLARRAARQLPVQTPENLRPFFYTGIRHFSETVIPKQPDPVKKQFGKSPASQLVGRHVSHSSQPASRQAL